jgi:hypothetical protein
MAKRTKKAKREKQYVEGAKAHRAFENAMKVLFRASKKPREGKD